MDVKEILDAINGPNEQGRKKTKFGLFHEIWDENGAVEEVNHLYVSKPIINVSRFSGESNQLYYGFEFVFNSNGDEDYKKMWFFLDRFASDSLKVKEEDTEVPGLTLCIFPDAFKGEYFVLASVPLIGMIEKKEIAGFKTASINLCFEESCVQFLQNDADTFNTKALQEEIIREYEETSVSN